MMQCFSHCLFAYLITRRTVLVEEMGKKSKSHWEKYYPSGEAGGHSCNILPIYEEMALNCVYLLIK